MLYSELLAVDKSKEMDKASEWVNKITQDKSKTNPTIVTGEFDHWFLNNLADKFLSLETNLGVHINENMLILCLYYVSDIVDENLLKTIVEPHSYIIIDNLSQILKFTNENKMLSNLV